MKRSEIIFSLIQIVLDFIFVILAGAAAYLLRTSEFVTQYRPILFYLPLEQYALYLLIGAAMSVIFFVFAGLYSFKVTRFMARELFLVFVALTAGVVAIALYFFIAANPFESRFIVISWWIFAIFFVSISRILLRRIQRFLTASYGIGAHNVLLVGHQNPGRSKEFLSELKQNPQLGFRVRGEVFDIKMNKIRSLIAQREIDDVFLTDLSYPQERILELANFCHRMQLNFSFIPSEFASFRTDLRSFPSGLAILEVKHTPLEGWGKIIKDGTDFIMALGIAMLGAPFFLLITFFIKLDSRGPVFVRLKRVREGEKTFYLYKFRSMIPNTHEMRYNALRKYNVRQDGPLIKIRNDPRITRVGNVLRRFHLDEFAQVINVLKGEMSLVGPRPHEPEEIAHYRKHHMRLLSVKPGITGLSQVSGASNLPFEREVELDTYYIEHWSFGLDFSILLRTILVIFTHKSAM